MGIHILSTIVVEKQEREREEKKNADSFRPGNDGLARGMAGSFLAG